MTIQRWQDWILQMEWRQWLRHRPLTMALQLYGLLLAAGLAAPYVPPPFHVVVEGYLVWMLMSLLVGMAFGTRWWLTWLVGTLLWSVGVNALCMWQLTLMVGQG